MRLPPFWTGLWMLTGSTAAWVLLTWLQRAFTPATLHPMVIVCLATLGGAGAAIMLTHRRVVSVAYFHFKAGPQAFALTSHGEGEAAFAAFVQAVTARIERSRGAA